MNDIEITDEPSSEHAPSAAGCYGRCELWLT